MYTSLPSAYCDSTQRKKPFQHKPFTKPPPNFDQTSKKCEEKPISYWVRELGLHMSDKSEICNGVWLSDKHISATNTLLTAQFPAQEGFQENATHISLE